jgi:adenylosuccinate lyase
MPSPNDTYTSPLAERNASPEMLRLWSPRHKFNTWRRIWLAVAEAQHELGLPVTKEQVEELRGVVERKNADGSVGITDAEIELAKKYERELRHDVMAHVHALGDSCPKAKGIIHLGMTSQDVNDNAELDILSEAVAVITKKMAACIDRFAQIATQYQSLPTLAFTHYQAAQPCTVGRRFAQWAHDLKVAHEYSRFSRFEHWVSITRRGLRGATGTQASYLELLSGNASKVDELEWMFMWLRSEDHRWPASLAAATDENVDRHREHCMSIAKWCRASARDEFSAREHEKQFEKLQTMSLAEVRENYLSEKRRAHTYSLVTQTYPRVVDTFILADLASTASVLHKIATDIRLLSNRKEIDEPFESKQIGSSAMPYKRNPMRCERICGLTRFVMNLVGNAYDTAATQWLERTLDDSSNRRLSLPEAFLALDGSLDLMHNVASGLIVHEAMVRKNLMAELPFMATENLLMACVKLGGDRQHYHELIRQHAQAAGLRVKQEGLENDLLDRLRADVNFRSKAHGGPLSQELDWSGLMDPMKYVGRSVEQTERFIREVVEPLREQYGEAISKLGESGPKV